MIVTSAEVQILRLASLAQDDKLLAAPAVADRDLAARPPFNNARSYQ